MLSLNLPSATLKIADKDGKRYILDILRKRYVALTPEEWVRQHFVHYLINHMGYPSGLLANEVSIKLNGTSKRCDTVLYSTSLSPRMIVEYKAPVVNITQEVFNQISRYNIVLRVDYLIVTNGITHYCCKVDYENGKCTFLPSVPHYSKLR
ncbi:MAG: type I restriction enzyme HsdR N-terminal domain-containing protein [Candidatus Phocaeicola faecipullorum]|nr:type I restriction enzyme HsdR N-terminal domain-containing protein [Candidatus Phocaeicola faecipullorum]